MADQMTGEEQAYFVSPFAEVGTIPPDVVINHTGAEIFAKMLAGEIPPPPICKILNFILVSAEEGKVVFEGVPRAEFYNPLGSIHGGWPATLLDSAMGCAIQTTLPKATGMATVEFKINLVRPLFADSGKVTCRGKLIHAGKSIATSEARMENAEGKLIAYANCTCSIFPFAARSK